MKLSLGPSLFFWSGDKLTDFYQQMAKTPVDIVYFGETVCSKRRSFNFEQWFDLAKAVAAEGKEVVLSTLALIEAESELKTLRRFCDNGDFTIEANDMAAVQLMAEKKLPFITGPTINVYNAQTLKFYQQQFGIKRAVLPRVLSISQVQHLAEFSPVELEVFGFGSLCIMAEGRCHLSSYVTGESPNTCGVCSPAKDVRWEETPRGLESRLNNVLIDRYSADENSGYPTLCKGRFKVRNQTFHVLEEPTSLNTLSLLPELAEIGISAIKIEGRQRSPAYSRQVTEVWRAAIDNYMANPAAYKPQPQWQEALSKVSEGSTTTLGAYSRPWQ